jgi:hypothetical protein
LGTAFAIGTDGVFRKVSAGEIAGLLSDAPRGASRSEHAAARAVLLARERGDPDDITLHVVTLHRQAAPGPPRSVELRAPAAAPPVAPQRTLRHVGWPEAPRRVQVDMSAPLVWRPVRNEQYRSQLELQDGYATEESKSDERVVASWPVLAAGTDGIYIVEVPEAANAGPDLAIDTATHHAPLDDQAVLTSFQQNDAFTFLASMGQVDKAAWKGALAKAFYEHKAEGNGPHAAARLAYESVKDAFPQFKDDGLSAGRKCFDNVISPLLGSADGKGGAMGATPRASRSRSRSESSEAPSRGAKRRRASEDGAFEGHPRVETSQDHARVGMF